ncbi:hypothetical protein [Streptomyces sp. MST-110588]|uniref:hypothetical protein n=1 Tax=Streptomyces sp. MST-110588 TaxID=2833628 RepID=UPI001F5C2B1E|nr:hypothetical protein [Streptomyces sp. MST-110588]UNO41434.1 hypothetical protein KGS77_20005 [Streptomyces sp. MST-110588]
MSTEQPNPVQQVNDRDIIKPLDKHTPIIAPRDLEPDESQTGPVTTGTQDKHIPLGEPK